VIRIQYDTTTHQIDEEDLMAVVMSATPEKYTSIIMSEHRGKGTNLTLLDDLEALMYQMWRQSSKLFDKEVPEINLCGFEGYCYHCKQQGHKADACPNRPKPTFLPAEAEEEDAELVEVEPDSKAIVVIAKNKTIWKESVGRMKKMEA
jgi:hypothetical protein